MKQNGNANFILFYATCELKQSLMLEAVKFRANQVKCHYLQRYYARLSHADSAILREIGHNCFNNVTVRLKIRSRHAH